MAMTIVVTRNSPDRVRGFLASCMCEIAPGIYTAPRMTVRVRERVWKVLSGWFEPSPEHAILMTWPDTALRGGQAIQTLGVPRQDLWDADGVFLVRRSADEATLADTFSGVGQDARSTPDPG